MPAILKEGLQEGGGYAESLADERANAVDDDEVQAIIFVGEYVDFANLSRRSHSALLIPSQAAPGRPPTVRLYWLQPWRILDSAMPGQGNLLQSLWMFGYETSAVLYSRSLARTRSICPSFWVR